MPEITEEELEEIEAIVGNAYRTCNPADGTYLIYIADSILKKLIAEVRRLREENERLQDSIRGDLAECLKVVDKINAL